ncbi:Uncharacterised protein [Bordetella pertussis]|nr:Uncharacterised protein [Bordetella pertussis]
MAATATPFSSMARASAASASGTSPRFQAWPSMNMFDRMLSPNRACAAACASRAATCSPAAWRIFASRASARSGASGLRVKSDTGAT